MKPKINCIHNTWDANDHSLLVLSNPTTQYFALVLLELVLIWIWCLPSEATCGMGCFPWNIIFFRYKDWTPWLGILQFISFVYCLWCLRMLLLWCCLQPKICIQMLGTTLCLSLCWCLYTTSHTQFVVATSNCLQRVSWGLTYELQMPWQIGDARWSHCVLEDCCMVTLLTQSLLESKLSGWRSVTSCFPSRRLLHTYKWSECGLKGELFVRGGECFVSW